LSQRDRELCFRSYSEQGRDSWLDSCLSRCGDFFVCINAECKIGIGEMSTSFFILFFGEGA
jgi:hypothetical protein